MRRRGADGSLAFDAAVLYPAAMFLLAHLVYMVLRFGLSAKTLESLEIVKGGFWGGLAIYLGLLFLYAKLRRFSVWRTLDAFSPAVLLSLGLGKVGCFLGGCCWGGPAGKSFGLRLHENCPYTYPKVPLHPVPLYDALWAGLGVLFLIWLSRRRRPAGTLFFTFILFFSLGRFATEFLRYSYIGRTAVLGLHLSQVVEGVSAALALALLIRCLWGGREAPESGKPLRDSYPAHGADPPGYGSRVLAMVVDLATPSLLLGAALFADGDGRLWLLLGAGAVYLFTNAVLLRTPGQHILGLALVNGKGERPSVPRRLMRSLFIPLTLLSIIGIFRPLASSSRQSFHDMAAGLHVVEKREILPGRPAGPAPEDSLSRPGVPL